MKSRSLFADLADSQLLEELVNAGDILSLEANLPRAYYLEDWEKLCKGGGKVLNESRTAFD